MFHIPPGSGIHCQKPGGFLLMLNAIWAFMIIIGILYGAFTGNIGAVSEAALSSAQEGVELCMTMLGVMSLWMGMMEIARESGMITGLTEKIGPFVRFLFPGVPQGHPALEYISAHIIANVLGLGWACTPAGLKAMEALAQLEEERGTPGYSKGGELAVHDGSGNVWCGEKVRIASNEMCMFLILNISSLQLIPVNMIAYRSQYGSVSPTAIVGPAIVATAVSTLVGIVFAKVMER